MAETESPEISSIREKHLSETMNSLGEKRLSQGVKPNLKHLFLEAKDISEMEIDKRTGLLNNDAYERKEKELVKIAKRFGIRLVFMRFDVNKLKQVNDKMGHSAGNQLLSKVGQTIGSVLRETDIAGRVGGDEFKVTLAGTTLEGSKKLWIERLLPGFNSMDIEISAGASEVDFSSEENLKESDNLADDAQSKAKIASRESNKSEFRTTEDLTENDIMNRDKLRKTAERKAA